MKEPDKIYTCYNIEEGEKRQLWSTVLLSDVEQVGEYIRKDALLEWAKETYLNENASAIRKVCYKQLIDKIESL